METNMSNAAPGDLSSGMRKEFLSFLKSIATFKGDLSSFTAPPFILSTTSLVEYPAYWVEQPARFVAPAQEENPQRRALLVLIWFLTTLKQQYDHRKDRKRGKPLNPILGELFLGAVESETLGATQIVAEQVCHHPPVTAYKIWNEDNDVSLSGYHAAKTFFANRMVHMHKIGHVMLHLGKFNEDYLITFPQLHLEGFIPPPPYPEMGSEPVFIQSSSGYTSKVMFSGKGWLRGTRNTVSACLYTESNESSPLYTVSGQWSGTMVVKDAATGSVIEQYDANASTEKLASVRVAPLEEQHRMETRAVWKDFTERMMKRDMSGVSAEKNRIEVEQRNLRKQEEQEGIKWRPRFFHRTAINPTVDVLGAKIGYSVDPILTDGCWDFSSEDYAEHRKSAESK